MVSEMVRNYIRKTSRASYGSSSLSAALEAMKNGQPLKAASRAYGVPTKTLRRHRDAKVLKPGFAILGRHKSVFPAEYEQLLMQEIVAMEQAFYGLTTLDLRRLAFDLAEKMQLKHPFSQHQRMAGCEWLRAFLKRNPQLSIRSPQATSISRVVGFNKPKVDKFFQVYGDELAKHKFDAKNIWNMDESGITNVHCPAKVLASKGKRQVSKITSGEKGNTVTVICCMNASGNFVPPMMIFPRKRMLDLLMKGSPPGSIGAASPNGWTDSNLFIKWLQHFISEVKCTKSDPCILIMDGHQSHKTLEAIELARDNGVIMITLPPHCTHRMQPLDRTFFKALKAQYNVACDDWMRSHPGARISFFEMAELFNLAYTKCAAHEKAVNGFRVTGLWPFNSQVFSAEDFEGAELTNEEEKEKESGQDVDVSISNADDTGNNAQSHAEVDTTVAETPNKDANSVVPAECEDVQVQAPEQSLQHTAPHPGLEEAMAILQSLSPRPKIVKPRARKRKSDSAAVVTSSPYKLALEQQQSKTKSKVTVVAEQKQMTQATSRARRCLKASSTKSTSSKRKKTTSSTDETPCLFCEGHYCDSVEGFVQCGSCNLWAHYSCAGYDDKIGGSYICEMCQ